MKTRWKIVVAAAILALLAFIYLWPHFHAKWALAAYRAKLRRQGEKLDLAELIPPAPTNGPNGAQDLVAAASQLRLWSTNSISVAEKVGPGDALVSWKIETLPTMFSTNVWPSLAKEIAAKQGRLAQARAALANPVLYFPLDYNLFPDMPISHLAPLKSIAINLEQTAILDLHEGNREMAFENLRALTQLAAHFGNNEPTMISQLVRIAIQQIALAATWEALQSPDWTDEQLAELQKLWESFSSIPIVEPTIDMERLYAIKTAEKGLPPDVFDMAQSFSSQASGSSPSVLERIGLSGLEKQNRYRVCSILGSKEFAFRC